MNKPTYKSYSGCEMMKAILKNNKRLTAKKAKEVVKEQKEDKISEKKIKKDCP